MKKILKYINLSKMIYLKKTVKCGEKMGLVVVPSERVMLTPIHVWLVQANTI